MFYAFRTELGVMQCLPPKENGLNSCTNCYVIHYIKLQCRETIR